MATEKLSASLEDYLEAIYQIVQEKQAARAKDIVLRLAVSNASVTGALRALSKRGLINYAPYDIITLTATGQSAAQGICDRHAVLREFFTRMLGVNPKTAESAACKMEHAVSQDILDRFTMFIRFVEECPRAGEDWMAAFREHCRETIDPKRCKKCLTACTAVSD